MGYIEPTEPTYLNEAGIPIYWIDGANVANRPAGCWPELLVMHHTAGTDSREYLWQNDKGVSVHYLIGIYSDTGPAPRTYKYASETDEQTFTQGYSQIGNIWNPNPLAISIEMEGPPIDDAVLSQGALLARSIIAYWSRLGHRLLLVGHGHIDTQGKTDPDCDWTAFCRMVYS